MWPFRRKSEADLAIDVMDDVIAHVAEKWRNFQEFFVFKDGVGLEDQVFSFSVPMTEGIRNTFPQLRKSPDAVIFLFMVKGIEKSGTHTRDQLEKALGVEIPDH